MTGLVVPTTVLLLACLVSCSGSARPGRSPSGHRLPPADGRSPRAKSPRTVDQIIKDAMPEHGSDLPSGYSKDGTKLVELDMKMSEARYNREYKGISDFKGLVDENYRWTDNTLPYTIDGVFKQWQRDAIMGAMDEWERTTCIKFVPRTNQANYISIISDDGCWSYVGMEGGKQEVSIDVYGCVYHHTIVHELGHAVGFHHEQTRFDRDDWIEVREKNIASGMAYNFEKYKPEYVGDFGIKYDYWSVMHYGAYAFSGNGKMTIVPQDERYVDVIGTTPGLSFKDIEAIQIMYKCDEHCTNKCPEKAIRTKECDCVCNTGNPGNPTVLWDGVSDCPGGDDFYGETCLDYHEKCNEWADMGECGANPYYMLSNCREACKVCGEDAQCIDFNDQCPYWGLIGECERNSGWMNGNCRATCGVCDADTPEFGECKDTSDECAWAAANGDCETYPHSMLYRCPHSCNSCGPDKTCRNWDILCPVWADTGACENTPKDMNIVCPKACGTCSGGEEYPDCKNYHNDRECNKYAKTGECTKNPFFMLYNCAKSCKVCGDDALCLDRDPTCPSWKEHGWCEKDPESMHFICRASCGLCEDDSGNTPECGSYDFNCERLAKDGECDTNPDFMFINCPKHCKLCGPDKICRNWDILCPTYAEAGECDNSREWMERYCPKACDTCTGGEEYPDCRNYRDDSACDSWADSGECVDNPFWMLFNCAKSCKVCGDDAVCLDRDATCPAWKEHDWCEKDKENMNFLCQASCGLCEDASGNTPECGSYDFNCELWADDGQCDSDPLFMLKHCPKHCEVCGPNPVCKNFHPECEEWANVWQPSECDVNPDIMHLHCAPACGLCTPDEQASTVKPLPTTRRTIPTRQTTTPAEPTTPRATTPGTTLEPTTPYPKTCKFFPIEEEYCNDHDYHCDTYSSRGDCTSHNPTEVDRMARDCPKACGYCGQNIQCHDYDESCADWAKSGQCETNARFMDIKCPKTCKCCE